MAVTVLYRMSGSPTVNKTSSFTDVLSNSWYCEAANWAWGSILRGDGSNRFMPNDPLTKECVALMLYRMASNKAPTVQLKEMPKYADIDTISDNAMNAIKWCIASGILTSDNDGKLNPKKPVTRAELAEMIIKYDESNNKWSAAPMKE